LEPPPPRADAEGRRRDSRPRQPALAVGRRLSIRFPESRASLRPGALLGPRAGSRLRSWGGADVDALRAAIAEGLAPYRTADGGYRLQNEFHCPIAQPPVEAR